MAVYVGARGLSSRYVGAKGPSRYVGQSARYAWDALGAPPSYSLPTLPSEPANLIANDDFANGAAGWNANAGWSIADGRASYIGNMENDTNLEQDFAIPVGPLAILFDILESNEVTSAFTVQFGGEFLDIGTRRMVGTQAMMANSAGHTRFRVQGKRNLQGAITRIRMWEMANINVMPVDIYILAGQSNMAGNSARNGMDFAKDYSHPLLSYYPGYESTTYGTTVGGITVATDPLQHTGRIDGIGPGMSAGREMLASVLAGRRVMLVPCAQGGTALVGGSAQWNPDADVPVNLYNNMVAQAQGALAASPAGSQIKGMFWSQGETDNSVNVGDLYPPAFNTMLTRLRDDLGEPDLPCVILGPTPERDPDGRLTAAQASLDQDSGDVNAIAGVKFVAGPAGMAIPGDEIHFSAEGNRIRGKKGGVAMTELTVGA